MRVLWLAILTVLTPAGVDSVPTLACGRQPVDVTDSRMVDLPPDEMRSWRNDAGVVVRLDLPADEGDAGPTPRRSRWILFEDNIPIGRGHDLHDEIESRGHGRYSHWKDQVIFTASDGSDPRTNNKRYQLKRLDDAIGRVVFAGQDAALVLDVRDRLSVGGAEWATAVVAETGTPNSALPVNPAIPTQGRFGLQFEAAGEYRLMTDRDGPLRILVVDRSSSSITAIADSAVSFVASNSTGGDADVPAPGPGEETNLLRGLCYAHTPTDVTCGYTVRLSRALLSKLSVRTRTVSWVGRDRAWSHVGMEVDCGEAGWRYYDAHFGVRGSDAMKTALSIAHALRTEAARPVAGSAFEALTLTDTDRTVMRQTFGASLGILRLGRTDRGDEPGMLVVDPNVARNLSPDWRSDRRFEGERSIPAFIRAMYATGGSRDATGTEIRDR